MQISKVYIIKIITGGNGGVGKTTLLYRYAKGEFKKDTKMTVGLQFFVKTLQHKSVDCTLQIWDFGGEDRFRFMVDCYLKGAHVGLLLIDLTRPVCLERLPLWIKLFRRFDNKLPIIIVGSKYDLLDHIAIDDEQIEEMMALYHIKDYFKTSAKMGLNVDETFNYAAKIGLNRANYRIR
jgi:small GTP-binding protein